MMSTSESKNSTESEEHRRISASYTFGLSNDVNDMPVKRSASAVDVLLKGEVQSVPRIDVEMTFKSIAASYTFGVSMDHSPGNKKTKTPEKEKTSDSSKTTEKTKKVAKEEKSKSSGIFFGRAFERKKKGNESKNEDNEEKSEEVNPKEERRMSAASNTFGLSENYAVFDPNTFVAQKPKSTRSSRPSSSSSSSSLYSTPQRSNRYIDLFSSRKRSSHDLGAFFKPTTDKKSLPRRNSFHDYASHLRSTTDPQRHRSLPHPSPPRINESSFRDLKSIYMTEEIARKNEYQKKYELLSQRHEEVMYRMGKLITCHLCCENIKDAVLVGCGHRCCSQCAKELEIRTGQCPFCKREFDSWIKTFD